MSHRLTAARMVSSLHAGVRPKGRIVSVPEISQKSSRPAPKMTRMGSPRLKLLLAVSLFGCALGLALARVWFHGEIWGMRVGADWAMGDFYTAAYYPVRALLEGNDPHDAARYLALYPVHYSYPPYAPSNLIFHLPFGLVPPMPAAIAYFGLSCLLSLGLAHLAFRVAGVRPLVHRVLLLAGGVLLSRPGHWTLLLGQSAMLLTCATYFALLKGRDSPRAAGLALAVTLLKPTFGIPLALLLWAWGRYRAAIIGIGIGALVNLPVAGILAAREGGVGQFLRVVLTGYAEWQARSGVDPATSYNRIDAVSLVSRIVGTPLSNAEQALLAGSLLMAAAIVLHLLAKQESPPARSVAVGIICVATLLIGFHRGYDLVLLTAPFAALLTDLLPIPKGGMLRKLGLAACIVPAINWLPSESVMNAWNPSHTPWVIISSINSVCLAVLFLGYLGLGLQLSLRRATAPSFLPFDASPKLPA
jgi:hypothetical protein